MAQWILRTLAPVLIHVAVAVPLALHDDVLTNVTPASAEIEADWAQD